MAEDRDQQRLELAAKIMTGFVAGTLACGNASPRTNVAAQRAIDYADMLLTLCQTSQESKTTMILLTALQWLADPATWRSEAEVQLIARNALSDYKKAIGG